MPENIEILDEQLQYLNQQAKDLLLKFGNEYVDRLISEAYRLEANNRSTEGEPEIISTHIADANKSLRRPYQKRKNRWLHTILMISTFVAGGLFDLEEFRNNTVSLIIFIFLVITMTTTYVLLWERE